MRPLLALLLVACSGTPSKSECEAIVEHMIDVFTAGKLAESEGTVTKDYRTAVEKWRQILKSDNDATHETLVQICGSQMSSSVTSCVLAAKSEADLAGCFTN